MDLHIYTDGACKGNPGPGSWGYVVVIEGQIRTCNYALVNEITTNNRMELTAAIRALDWAYELLKEGDEVIIHSDSYYLIKGITEWIDEWIEKGFHNVKNEDLWLELDWFKRNMNVKFVKEDRDNVFISKADEYANKAFKDFKEDLHA